MFTRSRSDAAGELRTRANDDGGFGPATGPSEPEPTAIAALALGADPAGESARSWLRGHQRRDGTWAPVAGPPRPMIVPTALAALALEDGDHRTRAIDALSRLRAPALAPSPLRGWGWTPRMFGWVEPTAWATLVLKRARPAARSLIDDGERVLADRECVGGGWNYGNRTVYRQDLAPYVQTTAVALIALQGNARRDLIERGLQLLRARWRGEAGGLSTAMTVLALRLLASEADTDLAAARSALAGDVDAIVSFGDTVALAWAALALAGDIEALKVD